MQPFVFATWWDHLQTCKLYVRYLRVLKVALPEVSGSRMLWQFLAIANLSVCKSLPPIQYA